VGSKKDAFRGEEGKVYPIVWNDAASGRESLKMGSPIMDAFD